MDFLRFYFPFFFLHWLMDYIISEYSIIDYECAISYYGCYDKMLAAFASNTGSEYDINEPFDPHSGQAYKKMVSYLANDRRFKGIADVLRLPLPKLTEYLAEITVRCGVKQCHAMKFLHIEDASNSKANAPWQPID